MNKYQKIGYFVSGGGLINLLNALIFYIIVDSPHAIILIEKHIPMYAISGLVAIIGGIYLIKKSKS